MYSIFVVKGRGLRPPHPHPQDPLLNIRLPDGAFGSLSVRSLHTLEYFIPVTQLSVTQFFSHFNINFFFFFFFRYAKLLPESENITFFPLVAHWLCYFNSAINPVIYNFMSGKFLVWLQLTLLKLFKIQKIIEKE